MTTALVQRPYPQVEPWLTEDRWRWIALGLLALASVDFFVSAAMVAARNSFWMDEVLAVWTARQHGAGAIIRALERGSEFSPPFFHLLLHQIIQLGGAGRLPLRLPSIIGTYITGLCVFTLVRRRYSVPVAALAMVLCLDSGLVIYAVQARPYTLATACFAIALVAWDIPPGLSPPLWRAALITVSLTLAIGLHFYALVLAGSVGLMELAWTAVYRKVRWLHLLAISLGCLSILVWLPILHNATAFNTGDASSPYFYARPTIGRLIVSYVEVLVGQAGDLASPFGALAGLGVVIVVFKLRNVASTKTVPAADLDVIVGISCLIPAIIFVFAVVATHAFSPRYAISAAIGFSILIARSAAVMPRPQLACCLLIGVLMVGEARAAVSAPEPREQALLVLSHAPEGLSIATDDGLRYFELREGSVADVARRLVYVMRPDTSGKPDLTNEHQVLRWAKIDPTIKVDTVAGVLARQSKILIFSQDEGADLLPKLAADNGFQLTVENRVGSATLYLASRRSGELRSHG